MVIGIHYIDICTADYYLGVEQLDDGNLGGGAGHHVLHTRHALHLLAKEI